jgi:hypothetical protein
LPSAIRTTKKENAMQKTFFEGNGITSLLVVEGEEDLKLRPGINLNAPPSDGRCDCCKRHLSELKPYGKAGDPLVGDFDGALLIKTFRGDFPPDEEAERIMDEFFQDCRSEEDYKKAKERLIQKYGEEEAENINLRACASSQIGAFWLCRDCIILNEDEFYEKRFPGYVANKGEQWR